MSKKCTYIIYVKLVYSNEATIFIYHTYYKLLNYSLLIDDCLCYTDINSFFIDWVVNGVRLKREYISVDDQICLLKSIMAHKPIQKSSEVNNNIKANTIIDKNQQIQVLKSMVIKRSYGLPRVCTDVIELPKDIQVHLTC